MSSNNLYRKTPLMGWASWNCFKTDITEQIIKEQADALVSTGLLEYGYEYLNIDDGFFGGRDENGDLLFHKERFPNGIKVLADYAHSKGLKAGIYSEGGDKTCGFYYNSEGKNGENVGLYNHEERDLKMYLEDCEFDFIKVDWCGGVRLGLDEEEQYSKIGRIIDDIRKRTGKCKVYNICRWQFPGAWAAKVADSWRTGADIGPSFDSVVHQLDMIKPLARYCSPGHVNALDMMQIGNGMSIEDEKTHFAMWCMMSTPLMIGCDLTKLRPETLKVLKNKELIAINQDGACLQAYVIKELKSEDGKIIGEVWLKNLENPNERAIAFLNRSEEDLEISFELSEAGLLGEILSIRDLCKCEDTTPTNEININLKPHAVSVLKVKSEDSKEIVNKYDKGEFEFKPLQKISKQRAEEIIQNGGVLVDVRAVQEYKDGHIADAINIPYMDIHGIASWFLKDKKQDIVLYCSTGKRSSQAKQSLEYLGYENIYVAEILK